MSNNKQSSVEWFNCELEHLLKEYGFISKKMLNIHYKRAKAMHRVEIIESYASGSNDRLRNTINTNYYNETFGE